MDNSHDQVNTIESMDDKSLYILKNQPSCVFIKMEPVDNDDYPNIESTRIRRIKEEQKNDYYRQDCQNEFVNVSSASERILIKNEQFEEELIAPECFYGKTETKEQINVNEHGKSNSNQFIDGKYFFL